MNCKNCNAEVIGNFCSNCGQKTNVDTIDFKYLLSEINNSIFQVDHGFFYTIKQLAIAPGHSVKDFIDGKRKKYFKPITFVLILSTIYGLIAGISGEKTMLADFVSGWSNYENSEFDSHDKIFVFQWLIKNYAYAMLLLLPVFSLGSYLSFRKYKYNYFEHLVLNSFITGQQAIIYILFIFLKLVTGDGAYIEPIYMLFVLGYVFWSYLQFFNNYKKLKTFFLTVLSYVFYLIFISLMGLVFL
ncbi:DUF3667 domain-containing protein [Tenacibaculum jejuense]|uniref:DUF3667 domain-containing protein n=1 Tax=Tenacibaculum jejuense TaxID=584609 RepID=A0A238UEN7_9FLAO|nr:DUF3667 domain-containing protein [Tenacibaculum jejuense]SNR17667.1 conserved membrane protein of unknown function [Tenacibaculum jejuense]